MKTQAKKVQSEQPQAAKSVVELAREITPEQMSTFDFLDGIRNRLADLNEAFEDLSRMMIDWNPSGVYDRMPPTALVSLLSAQYEAFGDELSAKLTQLQLKKDGCS